MNVAILRNVRNFVIEDAPMPDIGKDEVLIRVKVCGICASELYLWNGKFKGVNFPLYLGHEPSGVVETIGEGVTNVNVGDRVTFLSEVGRCFAEYAKAKKNNVIKIPDHISFEEALGEPIACAVNGIRRSNIHLGETVVIIGCGFMGLLLTQLAALRGPSEIVAVDINDERLKIAEKFGAELTLNPLRTDPIEYIMEVTGGKGADIVIEATGEQAPLDIASKIVKTKGTIVIFGYHVGEPRIIDMEMWNRKGLDVINAHERESEEYMKGMQIGIKLLSKGKIKTKPLITNRYPLEQINRAFMEIDTKIGGLIKTVIIS